MGLYSIISLFLSVVYRKEKTIVSMSYKKEDLEIFYHSRATNGKEALISYPLNVNERYIHIDFLKCHHSSA